MADRRNDPVSEPMRARLLMNRHGTLTADQWKDMVFAPLVSLLLVLAPGIVVLGPRLGALVWGGFGLVALLSLAAVGVMLALRARRYARAPVYFAVMQGVQSRPFWMFWRPTVLRDSAGAPVRFSKQLAPYTPVRAGADYLVYYLRDGDVQVLLSLAPADHPDADLWRPSDTFEARFARRAPR